MCQESEGHMKWKKLLVKPAGCSWDVRSVGQTGVFWPASQPVVLAMSYGYLFGDTDSPPEGLEKLYVIFSFSTMYGRVKNDCLIILKRALSGIFYSYKYFDPGSTL